MSLTESLPLLSELRLRESELEQEGGGLLFLPNLTF